MAPKTGVYATTLKDKTPSYRASITAGGKHIALGSYPDEKSAARAYNEAARILGKSAVSPGSALSRNLSATKIGIEGIRVKALPFTKAVSLANFRDNRIYIKTPIYIFNKFFRYYFSPEEYFTFDADDLFFYSNHTITRRGNHLFVADYGMQVNIMSRYGIREHAVAGRDYYFVNGDPTDMRYSNIKIINRYHGVSRITKNGKYMYKAKIHINGDYVIGTYKSEEEAALAYNKTALLLKEKGCKKNFPENYVESLDAISYASIYNSIRISQRIRNLEF